MPDLRSALPAEDRQQSAITGWTRRHWEVVAEHLLAGVLRYATRDLAQYRLPGRASRSGPTSDGLEGFARTFLLATFWIAGGAPPEMVGRETPTATGDRSR